jgi:Protein of unknown function (DUF4239)
MESWLLQNFSTLVLGLGIVAVVTSVSLVGLMLVRRSVTLSTLESHHDVAGFILAVVGVVYAVLLAFVVVIVWQQFEDAKANVDSEAVAIGGLYRDAVALGPRTVPLRVALTRYSHSVVDEEWPTMSEHHQESAATDTDLNDVWDALRSVPAKSRAPSAFYDQASTQLHQLTELRRKRILDSGSQLPAPLWVVLIAGAIISIGFTYFFGVANFRAQALMVAALASIIGLVLFLVLSLDLPYSGDVGANPHPIEQTIQEFPHYAT